MRWIFSFIGLVVFSSTFASVAMATTITFDEPEAVSNLGSFLSQFNVGEVTFTPEGSTRTGAPMPLVTPRTTFDDRSPSPYSYDFISGNVMQVNSTELRIDFSQPISSFGFGAALNATNTPAEMQIELFDSGLGSLGTFSLTLDKTLVSQLGGTGSNSEGQFFVDGLGSIARVWITNFGDGIEEESKFNYVVDNITFQPVPEPSTLFLLSVGLIMAAHQCLGVRPSKAGSPA